MANLYGQLDLSKLGDFVRQNPEAVKVVTFKDGTTHKMLNVSISERRQVDNFGNDHYIKIYVPKEQIKQGVNYFIADIKSRTQANTQQQTQQQAPLPQTPEQQEQLPQQQEQPLPF